MKGSFPDILNNPSSGPEARKLYDDAQAMLERLAAEKWLTAHGTIGLFPANSVGDDIHVYLTEQRDEPHRVLSMLRQQGQHRDGVPNRALSDFIAPRSTGVRDYMGAFAVTAGHGTQEKIAEFKEDLNDYDAILLESLADRLAEAFAERLHQRVRKELWGYAPDENLDNVGLLKEQYRGIRPAPGYPACPEHTEKQHAVGAAGRRGRHRHRAHRVDGDVAGRLGVGLVLLPPGVAVLRGGSAGARPGRRLRRAQGLDPRRGRALALAQPRLRPGGLSRWRTGPWPEAVLWDMDGTLVDTEPYWIDAEFELAARHGGTWSREHALNLVGQDLLDSGRYIREHMGIELEPAADRRGAPRRGRRAGGARRPVAARCA